MIAGHDERGERRAEPLLLTMATGIVGITALVAALALVDAWWFLAATVAALLGCAGGVVALILRLLAQTGDPVPVRQIAPSHVAAEATGIPRARSRTAPATPAFGGA